MSDDRKRCKNLNSLVIQHFGLPRFFKPSALRTNNKFLVINNKELVMTLTKNYNAAFFYSEGESVIFRKPEFGAFLICN